MKLLARHISKKKINSLTKGNKILNETSLHHKVLYQMYIKAHTYLLQNTTIIL